MGAGSVQLIAETAAGGIRKVRCDDDGNLLVDSGGTEASSSTGATAASSLSPFAAAPTRRQWGIQNSGVNTLTVIFGTGTVILKACAVQDDGTGGVVWDDYWKGAVTLTGTAPRYNSWELSA